MIKKYIKYHCNIGVLRFVFILLACNTLIHCNRHNHEKDHDHETVELNLIVEGRQAFIQHRFPGSIFPGFERPVRDAGDQKIWQENISEFENNLDVYIQVIPNSNCKFLAENWSREEDGHHLDTIVEIRITCQENISHMLFDYSRIKGIENIKLLHPENPDSNKKYHQKKLEWKVIN
jgi:hypothetical protein